MADVTIDLLKTQLRQLRLPTMGQEFEKLARDAAASNQTFVGFLLLFDPPFAGGFDPMMGFALSDLFSERHGYGFRHDHRTTVNRSASASTKSSGHASELRR